MSGETLKAAGMARAAESRKELLDTARHFAEQIALNRGSRMVSINDVRREFARHQLSWDALGNAAGSIFKEAKWEFSGRWDRCAHEDSHARLVRVWRLK